MGKEDAYNSRGQINTFSALSCIISVFVAIMFFVYLGTNHEGCRVLWIMYGLIALIMPAVAHKSRVMHLESGLVLELIALAIACASSVFITGELKDIFLTFGPTNRFTPFILATIGILLYLLEGRSSLKR